MSLLRIPLLFSRDVGEVLEIQQLHLSLMQIRKSKLLAVIPKMEMSHSNRLK